ncbi:MAG: lysophospholipase [Vicinamibacteria bacterium]|nr:lysophospholipase [Vicinamibacteria bacterium]
MTIFESNGIEVKDGSFITRDGLVLSTYRFHVAKSGLEPVILIHGLSDHSRSLPYLGLAKILAAQGFEVFAFDRRGSGRSGGPPNYAATWDALRDDLGRFVDIVEDQCGRLPALVGLSLGGLQALDFALTSPESVHSCVAMAPALDVSGTSSWRRRLLPFLARWWPALSVDPGIDDSALVRDPAVCRDYRTDPLWRARTTPALALAVVGAVDEVRGRAEHLETPLLVFHGTADRVVPIQGTRLAFPRFGSKDKTLIEIPGAFHALPIEPEGRDMAERMAAWLKIRSRVSLSALA